MSKMDWANAATNFEDVCNRHGLALTIDEIAARVEANRGLHAAIRVMGLTAREYACGLDAALQALYTNR